MQQQTYLIRFKDVSDADASQYVQGLGNDLLDISPDIQVERRSEAQDPGDRKSQDLGVLLGLIFAGVSTVASIVQVIMAWQQAHNNAKIEIEKPDGSKLTLTEPDKKEERKALEEFLKKP